MIMQSLEYDKNDPCYKPFYAFKDFVLCVFWDLNVHRMSYQVLMIISCMLLTLFLFFSAKRGTSLEH